MIIYTKLLAQQREEEAQFESALGSAGIKSEVRSYGTSAYSSPSSRNQVKLVFHSFLSSLMLQIGPRSENIDRRFTRISRNIEQINCKKRVATNSQCSL